MNKHTYKKDVSPLHYNHKFASMEAFAQHLVLKDVRSVPFNPITGRCAWWPSTSSRGPIGDSRILAIDENTVTFSVKDRQSGRSQPVQLDGADFVRRYLQHALPSGFHRIRYYGFMHARNKLKLQSIAEQLGMPQKPKPKPPQSDKPDTTIRCPKCGAPMPLRNHRARAPPHLRTLPHIWNRKHPIAA